MKFLKIHLFAAILLCTSLLSAQTIDEKNPIDLGDRYSPAFIEQLNAIDTLPSADAMLKKWPNSVELMTQIGCDPKVNAYARSRAISMLSMFALPGRIGLEKLTICAMPETQERAIYTLARGFSKDPSVAARVLSFDFTRPVTNAMWAIRALRWLDHKDVDLKLNTLSKSKNTKIAKLATRILKQKEIPVHAQ